MATQINELNPRNILFRSIKSGVIPEWWDEIKNDNDLYIEIRKNYKIDVYYNGGAIFGSTNFKKGSYNWKTHSKYLIKSEYVHNNDSINRIIIGADNWLSEIKSNMKKHYPSDSEKGYQAKLRTQKPYFLDTEFAFNDKDNSRFDLVWVDKFNKKFLVVELKLPNNKELFDGSITNQVKKYKELISNHKIELEKYFRSLFKCKKEIGILSEELNLIEDIEEYTMADKPLLVVGNCNQEWINQNHETINDAVKEAAAGVYYFGNPNHCNIIKNTKRNRFIFE